MRHQPRLVMPQLAGIMTECQTATSPQWDNDAAITCPSLLRPAGCLAMFDGVRGRCLMEETILRSNTCCACQGRASCVWFKTCSAPGGAAVEWCSKHFHTKLLPQLSARDLRPTSRTVFLDKCCKSAASHPCAHLTKASITYWHDADLRLA